MAENWPTAAELMTRDPLTVESETPLSTALGLLKSRRIHELPVVQRGRVLGMVTYDAIARRHNVALSTKVEHVMIVAPVVGPSTPLPALAEKLLASGRRAACVVDPRRGTLQGVVSRTDLVRAAGSIPTIAGVSVVEAMSPLAATLGPRDRCREIYAHVRSMEDHPLPVVDKDKRLVGVVSLSDFGNAFWRPAEVDRRNIGGEVPALSAEVRSIMSTPPLVVPVRATVGEAARLMSRSRASSVFVEDDGHPVGVLGLGEVLGLVVRQEPGPQGAYIQITGLGAGTDPSLLTEVDHVLARSLRRIARFTRPVMLTIHVTPHAVHKAGDASVRVRLYGEARIYNASQTGFDLRKSVAAAMEEIERQMHTEKEERRTRNRGASLRTLPRDYGDLATDEDLEARLSALTANGGEEGRER